MNKLKPKERKYYNQHNYICKTAPFNGKLYMPELKCKMTYLLFLGGNFQFQIDGSFVAPTLKCFFGYQFYRG